MGPGVVERQRGGPGVHDPYGLSVHARRPHGRDRLVEVLLGAVWSGRRLGSDGGPRGRGRQGGLLGGQGAATVMTPAAVLAGFAALQTHRVVDDRPERLQEENTKLKKEV